MTLILAIVYLLTVLIQIILVIIAIAYYTLAERKVMAAIQRRRGPNTVGYAGLLQPLADGLKLIAKEFIRPIHVDATIFVWAPVCILTLSLITWSLVPFNCEISSIFPLLSDNWFAFPDALQYAVLVLLAASSASVYSLILAGWASNSKYAFLGSLRSAAQMISYEISISLILLPIIFIAGSFNLVAIANHQVNHGYFVWPFLPLTIVFFISMLAETNRTPFDLPEAEAELVAGYNVDYSAIIFAMFFLAEYANMMLMSALAVIFFFGGWGSLLLLPPTLSFVLKLLIFCFMFILIRAALPRYRYDQLMDIGWKIFLPLTTALFMLTIAIPLYLNSLPINKFAY